MTINNNATYLFRKPEPYYHNSESFWTSLLSMYFLMLSQTNAATTIESFSYREQDNKWKFENDGYLSIPARLKFTDIVVEGKIRSGFIGSIKTEIPNELLDIRPDIIFEHEKKVVIIEVKTVGKELGQYQLKQYMKLADFIRQNGYNSELYVLISAGHETTHDFKLFREVKFGAKLLLWEKILKHMCEYGVKTGIAQCLGDIREYYVHEDKYMQGLTTG